MHKPRWKRKNEILSAMSAMMPKANLTMSQISFWVGLGASNHFLKILHEMEAEGTVASSKVQHRPNMVKYCWKLTDAGVRKAGVIQDKGMQSWG